MSACFLFIIVFFANKVVIRKLFFINTMRLIPQGNLGITLPSKALFCIKSSMCLDEYIQNFTGIILTWIYSIFSLYKALKKYNNVKYIVSITRNFSRLTGWFCNLTVPQCFRHFLFGGYAYVYNINMDEVKYSDFSHYETFVQFFTRELKEGVRQISEPNNSKSMCSPCDGKVLTCGKINSEYMTIDCVKGRSYTLEEFMFGENRGKKEKSRNQEQVSSLMEKV